MKKVIFIILIGIIHLFIYAGIGIPEAPIDINIRTIPEIIQVGDIVHVTVKAKLDTTHNMYHPNLKYAITVDDDKHTPHAVRLQMKSPDSIKKEQKSWNEALSKRAFEIVSFSEDAILDTPDKIVSYSFSVKLNKDVNTDIRVRLMVFPFDTIEDFGGHSIYVFDAPLLYHFPKKSENETKKLPMELSKTVTIKYDSPNLPKFTIGTDGKPTRPLRIHTPGSDSFEKQLLESLNTMKVDMSGVFNTDSIMNSKTTYKVLINTSLELELDGIITEAYIVNDNNNYPIGSVSYTGTILTFNSSGNIGATGGIYFRKGGTLYLLSIILIGSYNIEGSFKYEHEEGIFPAYGKVLLVNNNTNEVLTNGLITLGTNGTFSYSGITTDNLGVYLFLWENDCIFIVVSLESIIYKNLGLNFNHLEFYNVNNEDVNITFTINDIGWNPEQPFNIFAHNLDIPFAYNVFNQQRRSENYSRNELGNAPRELIFIDANYLQEFPYAPYSNSFFGAGWIINNQNEEFDLIHIFGNSQAQHHLLQNNVILHELGHSQHWYHAPYAPGFGGDHSWNTISSDQLAWIEGFAHFFSCIVRSNDIKYFDYNRYPWDVEPSEIVVFPLPGGGYQVYECAEYPTGNPRGNNVEGAITATLWDLYDDVETGNPAWNNDVISYSILTIWNAIKNIYQVYRISDFLNVWVIQNGSLDTELLNVLTSHGITLAPTFCDSDVLNNNLSISSNYPNPFNPSTTISYSLADNIQKPIIEIYNIKGQKVKSYALEEKAGENSIIWQGKDENDKSVGSGVYFYRLLNEGKVVDTKKMLLIK